MFGFKERIAPALAGCALALCIVGPAAAIDVSLGGISASVGGNDDGGLDASIGASVGGVGAGVSTSVGGDGVSADVGLGTGGDGTGDGGGAGGSIGGRNVNDILQNMSEAELRQYKRSCGGILRDPNAYKWDLVQLCKLLAQTN